MGGAENTARIVIFVDDAISERFELLEDGRRCLGLSKSLSGVHFEELGVGFGEEGRMLVVVLTKKMHHAAFVVWPGRYFIRRCLNWDKLARGGGGQGRRKWKV